ncbi:2-C-methyl-D-erythritol 2,4-cyclodiphosphate synthase [Escherichia coli]|uniref:2-C-methyl-D-erythritol 2,4-cyclodiphosphate synthase n=1 Tax=Escherichia coli TaxID=562 RepID=A0A376TTQ9_ECOLX|nr:2-C-methyl-D-erythritol 2,4-cyclodiphosphate synthase [Escherichia coli]
MHCLARRRWGISASCSPDTDPAFKGADSRELLREAWRRIQAKGYTLGNVDVTIIAQAPKMLPHIPQMRVFIAEDLGCHMDDVNVKPLLRKNLDLPDVGKGLPVKRWRYSLRQQND